jgi:alpha-D-xyloside xylohydrolase
MPLEFPHDPESSSLIRQYMLGPSLLVGAFTSRVYLPAGEWLDFWTGQRRTGPAWVEPPLPPNRGGPLFVPAGAVVPMGKVMDYVGERPDDELTVHIYAGALGRFTLYEDNGTDFAHESGAFRTTEIRHEAAGGTLRVQLAAAQGDFDGAPQQRKLSFVLHGVAKPQRVALDGKEVDWTWDEAASTIEVLAGERPVSRAVSLELTS